MEDLGGFNNTLTEERDQEDDIDEILSNKDFTGNMKVTKGPVPPRVRSFSVKTKDVDTEWYYFYNNISLFY